MRPDVLFSKAAGSSQSLPYAVALLFGLDNTGEELLGFDLRVRFCELVSVNALGYLKALCVESGDEVHVAIVGVAKGLNNARIGALSRRNEGFQCAVNSLVPTFGDRRDHFVLRDHHWVLWRLTDG